MRRFERRFDVSQGATRVSSWSCVSIACLLVGVVLQAAPKPTLAQNPGVAVQSAGTIQASARVAPPEIGSALAQAERYADSLVARFDRTEPLDPIDIVQFGSGIRIVATLTEPQPPEADDLKSPVSEPRLQVSLMFTAN